MVPFGFVFVEHGSVPENGNRTKLRNYTTKQPTPLRLLEREGDMWYHIGDRSRNGVAHSALRKDESKGACKNKLDA